MVIFFLSDHCLVEIENLANDNKKSKMVTIGMILELSMGINQLKKNDLTLK